MSNRDIFCDSCGAYVGVIRDAKLMKGLKFICPKCPTVPPERNYNDLFTNDKGFADVFGDLFGSGKTRH